jgi:DNA-binding response OmpR family regulator
MPCDRILVVDDDRLFLELMLDVLRELGMEVVVCSFQAAPREVPRIKPDLILVKLKPLPAAETIVESFRSDPASADIPIVAISSAPALLRRLQTTGATDGALAMPFDFDQLKAILDDICGRATPVNVGP